MSPIDGGLRGSDADDGVVDLLSSDDNDDDSDVGRDDPSRGVGDVKVGGGGGARGSETVGRAAERSAAVANDAKRTGGGGGAIKKGAEGPRGATVKTCSVAVVDNPYKRRRGTSAVDGGGGGGGSDKSGGSKKKTMAMSMAETQKYRKSRGGRRLPQPLPTERRDLQVGLVFEEDVHHHTTAAAPSSAKPDGDGDDRPSAPGEEGAREEAPSASAYRESQFRLRVARGLPPVLYHDPSFAAGDPASVDGAHGAPKLGRPDVKCKCRPAQGVALSYGTKNGPNLGRPFFRCPRLSSEDRCKYFTWAYSSHFLRWHRFGPHNGYRLVDPRRGFCAEDLIQGRVGDCWFLSALAVVAERPDLIGRIMAAGGAVDGGGARSSSSGRNGDGDAKIVVFDVDDDDDLSAVGGLSNKRKGRGDDEDYLGVVEVTLFVDGYWKRIVMDDFLPCAFDRCGSSERNDEENRQVELALEQSLIDVDAEHEDGGGGVCERKTKASGKGSGGRANGQRGGGGGSRFDPLALADECARTLREAREFLHFDRLKKDPNYRRRRGSSGATSSFEVPDPDDCRHPASTSNLAYSKAKRNQLWVPLLEKAYAKTHGSYHAISGGHVAEAFLDLTGAPTVVYDFDHSDFNAKKFWSELMKFRRKRLPMGCGTTTSQSGIVGMHAYSILEIREVKGLDVNFFRDKLLSGTMGGVSGFTEFDGTVRLLRIRNPHGKGEWKGEFSDQSPVWEKLLAHQAEKGAGGRIGRDFSDHFGVCDLTGTSSPPPARERKGEILSPKLERTMTNDGTFWIGYDDFLMGFSNVDVVLAFEGNHAKSFGSKFPAKKSNHRCARAFEVSAVERQPGELEGDGGCGATGGGDSAEVYVMGIQKTGRGARRGRTDRKKSYKACDLGIIVCERSGGGTGDDGDAIELGAVGGRFFGLTRNGHVRLTLDRRSRNDKMIVVPISFGHPAATDDEFSFVIRFVSDVPLLVRELPEVPSLHVAVQKYCFGSGMASLGITGTSFHRGVQGARRLLAECRVGRAQSLFKVYQIDCLAGGGGTVLIYLCVNGDLFRQTDPLESKNRINFSIEVNCRGMVCRTADGLLEHETISKGKMFQAAWRRYSRNFRCECQSRLLMAVVQSGKDHQMGSIKCGVISAVSDNMMAADAGPMSRFVEKVKTSQRKGPSGTERENRYNNYEEFGIFTGTDTLSDSLAGASIWSNNGVLIDESVVAASGDPFALDPSLENAVRKSREEYETREALRRCKEVVAIRDNRPIKIDDYSEVEAVDCDLEAAIMASLLLDGVPTSKHDNDNNAVDADDMAKAIELSLGDR